jgi:cation diffusion facilitator family transporter
LLGAVVSIAYNYIMFGYATCVGRRNNSPAILADAFENKADAISSVACVGGILGAMFIHPICDPIAALMVGLLIFWNCQEQLREAARGLLDMGLEPEDVEHIKKIALKYEGVLAVSFVKTRRTGARYWMDIGVEVPADLHVDRIDEIAAGIRDELKTNPLCHHVEVFAFPHGSAENEKLLASATA